MLHVEKKMKKMKKKMKMNRGPFFYSGITCNKYYSVLKKDVNIKNNKKTKQIY